MRPGLFVLCLSLCSLGLAGQDSIQLSKNLQLIRISGKVYIHTSWIDSPQWGRFRSNGWLVVESNEALLFDTP